MRHRVYGKKLGRNVRERTALFRSLVQGLLIHGTIQTSQTKAQAIKGLVDKVINLAKNKNTHHLLKSFLAQDQLAERLIKEVAPKLSDRTSGYTTVVKLGNRAGDNAMVVKMSLIGSEKMEPIKKEKNVKTQSSNVKSESQNLKTSKEKKKGGKPEVIAKPAGRRVARKR